MSRSSSFRAIIATALTGAIASTAAVFLRLLSKHWTKKPGVKADDYWIVFAAFSSWVYVSVTLWGLSNSGGASLSFVQLWSSGGQIFLKSTYIAVPIYGITISAVRFSILYLYRRVFTTSSIRRATTVLIAACVAWLVAAEIASIGTCRPIEHYWNKRIPGHCFNFNKFFLGITLAEILLNVTILCLPLRTISALQLPLRHKISLFVTFLIGGFVCITDVVRVIISYRPQGAYSIYYPNPRKMARICLTFTTVNFVDGIIWSNIHLGTAIICACLPTYRPLIVQCATLSTSFIQRYDFMFSNKSRPEKLSSGDLSRSTNLSSQQHSYSQLDQHHGDQAVQVNVSGGLAPGDMNVGDAPNSIEVRMTIEIV